MVTITNIFLVGATGRVGTEFLQLAVAAGHSVTALVRDSNKLALSDPRLTPVTGDLHDATTLAAAFSSGTWDAVVNVAGTDPLKASTLVTDAAQALVPLAEGTKTPRYLGITGTAQMPKTPLGRISTAILRRTPVGHGARDHDGAYAAVKASALDWALVGCPWIKDGPTRGTFKTREVFPGGMKTIHPGDVALALFRELEHPTVHREIAGIWY
ncbi:MAG TPA: NAD(P)H-binding protein [Candidatus Dormibacteraeota bacterium]|nr:NAD(P)H-binding protein [Candidatus Dormibacteraeota bacterium]